MVLRKVLIIIILLLLLGCHNSQSDLILEEMEYQVKMVAVGDNLIHQTIYESAKVADTYDFKPIYQEIKPYIKSFDLAFINQETILGGKELGLSSYPCFNSPYELGDALIDAGFNLISIANNHTLDRGEQAVLNSINYWESKSIIYSGATKSSDEENIKFFEINNIKFAFLAYTYGTNGIPHPKGKTHLAAIYSDLNAEKDFQRIPCDVDIIIVSMHWGEEYQDYPNSLQKHQANYLSELGADIIIGHHPHVIQPIDIIGNSNGYQTVVFYSLGNFLSDQKGMDRLIGAAGSFSITKKINEDKIAINISEPKVKLLYRCKKDNIFKIKFFENLDETILLNYDIYFKEKEKLIQAYYKVEVS